MATFTYNSNTIVTGTSNADLLLGADTAGNNNDIVYGLQDADTVNAAFSLNNSTLYGGQGDDVIYANNHNVVYGNQGNDSLEVFSDTEGGILGNDNTVYGGQGNDTIDMVGETDSPGEDNVAYGGLGDNKFFLNDQLGSTVFGGSGDDSIDAFYGTALLLYGSDPGSSIYGNDTIRLHHTAASTAYGGQGDDSIYAIYSTALTIYGSDPASSIYGNDSIILESVTASTAYGGPGDDTIASNDGSDDTVYGGAGADILVTDNSSGDILYGNQGNDSIEVNFGNGFGPPFEIVSDVTAYGGQGNDSILQFLGAHGVLYGNKGNDLVLDVLGAGNLNNSSLGPPAAASEGNSALYGGQGDDTLVTSAAGGDTMFGGQGDNLFVGNDIIFSIPDVVNGQSVGVPPSIFPVNDLITVGDFVSGNDHLSMSNLVSAQTNDANAPGFFKKEDDPSANNAGDALLFANDYFAAHSSSSDNSQYLFVYGGSDAGYLFYNGTPFRTDFGLMTIEELPAPQPTTGMILVGDNAESSVSANDIVASNFARILV